MRTIQLLVIEQLAISSMTLRGISAHATVQGADEDFIKAIKRSEGLIDEAIAQLSPYREGA